MGDMADDARARAEALEFDRIINAMKEQDPDFDSPDKLDLAEPFDNGGDPEPAKPVKVVDPMRPEPKRGRYHLPHPETGAKKSWRRVSNLIKLADNTYHLELWKQRNVARGVALLIKSGRLTVDQLVSKDVKADKAWLDNVTAAAQDAAEAYKMADAGTALHKSTELVDMAGGDLNRAPDHHRAHVRLYLDALAAHGITIVPGMVERSTVSLKYDVAGTFDRIGRLADGSYVIVDLKTGDRLDLAMPGIAAQMDCYENGVNTHGIWDGVRYDKTIQVRDDIALVVHLPSTRLEVDVIPVGLAEGRRINATNCEILTTQKIKAKDVVKSLDAIVRPSQDVLDQHWLEQLNAAHTRGQLVSVAARAKLFGQWNQRLASQARIVAAELRQATDGMES